VSIPPIDEPGLNIGILATLSREELANWIVQRLRGRDITFPDIASDEMPHYAIAALYLEIDYPRRLDIEHIVLNCLRELLSPSSLWLNASGDELLMLIDPVMLNTFICLRTENLFTSKRSPNGSPIY